LSDAESGAVKSGVAGAGSAVASNAESGAAKSGVAEVDSPGVSSAGRTTGRGGRSSELFPGVPGLPSVPNVPDLPGVPGVPGVLDVPGVPGGQDDQAGPVLELLGSGREADVYALDAGRVLRRYRRGDDATAEAALMEHLAAQGFPVPRADEVRGADMLMERLDGPTMAAAFAAGDLGVDESAAILADLHRRLHALPPRTGRTPGDRILHQDLHPENVMLTARGPVVIDWHNATEGPPDVDVCLTMIIMAQVAADPAQPHATAAAGFIRAFQAQVGGEPLAALDEALRIRRADPSLSPEESAALAATVTPFISGVVRSIPHDQRIVWAVK
jgi:tRNA A-37 threonylcarbamoyl transferase component Bud32